MRKAYKKNLILLFVTILVNFSSNMCDASEKNGDISLYTNGWGLMSESKGAKLTYKPNIGISFGMYFGDFFKASLGMDSFYISQDDELFPVLNSMKELFLMSPHIKATYDFENIQKNNIVPYAGLKVGTIGFFTFSPAKDSITGREVGDRLFVDKSLFMAAGIVGVSFKISNDVRAIVNYEPTKWFWDDKDKEQTSRIKEITENYSFVHVLNIGIHVVF